MRRVRLMFTAVLLSLFTAFVGMPAAAQPLCSPIPEPSGPYKVGTTLRHLIDEARPETYRRRDPSRGEFRELMVQVWYPAEVPDGAEPISYLLHPSLELEPMNAMFHRFGFGYQMPEAFAEAPTHAYRDAPVSDAEPRYPVIVFSPGLGGPPSLYHTQMEALASHGYVVAGIYHTYNAPAAVFPDGQVIVGNADTSISTQVWSDDQRFVLDALTAIDAEDPEGMFTGRLDVERAGVFGHSYGGTASFITIDIDPRFDAGLNMDGTLWGLQHKSDERPVMVMFAADNPVDEYLMDRLGGPAYALQFAGYFHGTFIGDLVFWQDSAGAAGAACAPEDAPREHELTTTYLLAFFDRSLKGEASPLLEGNSADYPEVSVAFFEGV